MENQIKTLLDDIKTDYINWSTSNGTKPISSYTQGVLDAFDDNVEVKYGQKYIKILPKSTQNRALIPPGDPPGSLEEKESLSLALWLPKMAPKKLQRDSQNH